MPINRPKIICVVGQTATGKSSLAITLAKKFNGEVISADSRQVYRGMDIGTGKVSRKEMGGIRHHLLDVAAPKKRYTVADFQRDARLAITDILKRGKLPVICGGTGFYVQTIIDGISLPEVPPNKLLRKKLSALPVETLLAMLRTLDARRAVEIDKSNKVRLIRAIEIATALGKVPEMSRGSAGSLNAKSAMAYDALMLGIRFPDSILRQRIHDRLLARMKNGMMSEAKRLHANGLSWKRMEELGLEYRFLARHLTGKISKEEMLRELETAIWHYAKRQKTWFKRDNRIRWFPHTRKSDFKKIRPAVLHFLAH